MTNSIAIIGSFVTATFVECDVLPSVGESVHARRIVRTVGGKGFNMAIQAARLGHDVRFVCAVGEDAAAEQCVAALRTQGISTEWVFRVPGISTGDGVVIRDGHGDNMIALDTGANARLSLDHIAQAAQSIAESTVAIAQLEVPCSTALEGLRVAKSNSATTILNPAPWCPLHEDAAGFIDYLTPNESELLAYADLPSATDVDTIFDAGTRIASTGPWCIIGTRGAQGCVVFSRDEMKTFPAFSVSPVDSTGAGDSFNAAFACGLAEGLGLKRALRLAAASAALSVTRCETIDAFPTRTDVDRLLRSADFSDA